MTLNRCCSLLIGLVAGSCSSSRFITTSLQQTEKQFQDHIGFVLYDPAHKKTICDFQGASNFTPASNTKIFTLYAALNIIRDSIPALRYTLRNDSVIFWGTGAPGFLYENTSKEDRVYNFLKTVPANYFSLPIIFKMTGLDQAGCGTIIMTPIRSRKPRFRFMETIR